MSTYKSSFPSAGGEKPAGGSENPATNGVSDRTHVVFPAAGELQTGDGPQVDPEAELGIDGADCAVEFEAPAVQIPVQAVLLTGGRAGGNIEGGRVADLPVPGQVGIDGEVPGSPRVLGKVSVTIRKRCIYIERNKAPTFGRIFLPRLFLPPESA